MNTSGSVRRPAGHLAVRLAVAAIAACLAVSWSVATAAAAPSDPRLPRPRPASVAAERADLAPATARREDPATADAAPAEQAAALQATAALAPPPLVTFGFPADRAFRDALDRVDAKDYSGARALAAAHPDPLVRPLIDWTIARRSDSGLSAQAIIALVHDHPDWPDRDRLTLMAEQAFHALGPSGEAVLTFYSRTPPRTIGGSLAYAAALREAGRRDAARGIVRDLWRGWTLSRGQQAAILTRFGAELTRDDHVYRFRRLLLNGDATEAAGEAAFLGAGYDDLAAAVDAALLRDGKAQARLDAVKARFPAEPLIAFAEALLRLRADKPAEAARIVLASTAEASLPGDPDAWWDLRRDLSRELLDGGQADLAYRIAAGGRPDGAGEAVEAAFHAGWYALRFLRQPAKAEPHFRDLIALATLPRTRARASYWMGRSFEAEDKAAAARLAFTDAAQYGGTFYGQLAREKLGIATTGLERVPGPSAMDRVRFAGREGVHAVKLFAAAGAAERAGPFVQRLAQTLDSPGEVALLTALARRIGQPRAAMQAAAAAEARGVRVASLPAPFIGVPARLPLPEPVDRALVYAVVRQESAFNHQAASHVGALGLMQLMPATAKATAASARLPYSVERLSSDPLYNATLGAHHLGELLDRLNRSYVLTFVAYNAGPTRARDWLRAYGDLRGGGVDPVDWIERIPFDETRDYVQKVMENLQVYRSRIGHPLALSRDLARGGPQG